MYTILIEQSKHSNPLAIYCENKDIYGTLNILEHSESVVRYKIQASGLAPFNEYNLRCHIPGLVFPSGKAHWEFSWEKT